MFAISSLKEFSKKNANPNLTDLNSSSALHYADSQIKTNCENTRFLTLAIVSMLHGSPIFN